MPLYRSRKAVGKNIRQLMREGRPQKQAIAIAMRKAGLSRADPPQHSRGKAVKKHLKKKRKTTRTKSASPPRSRTRSRSRSHAVPREARPREAWPKEDRAVRQYIDSIGRDVLSHQERLHQGFSGRAGRRGL